MTRNILLYFFVFCFFTSTNAQVFVKQDASGNNDGTSWADAYSNLNDALNNTNAGEIWIAAGTYHPENTNGIPDSSATFRISNPLSLYGGFIGTESNLTERDFENNKTILSADINDDDIDNVFDSNKSDNVQHVLFVDSLIASTVVIDGFNITGGNASNNADVDITFRNGGGIFSYSTIEVNNCTFYNNFARGGGGIYISPGAGGGNGSSVDNCFFYNHLNASQGACLLVTGLNDFTLTNSTFKDNTTVRGAFYPNTCSNVMVDNCTFENNQTLEEDGFGGAIFVWQNVGLLITNSIFKNNIAGNAGVIYHDGRDTGINPSNLIMRNCDFEGNQANDFSGGVIYGWQSGFTLEDCEFLNNSSLNGGAVYFDHREHTPKAENVMITNCDFIENEATDFGGGAIYVWRGSMTVDNSFFDENIAPNASHIFTGGDDKEVIVKNSSFQNGASNFGAAHNCYGFNSNFYLTNNTYENGESMTSGGALMVGFQAVANIESCKFIRNQAEFGGAVYVQNDSTVANFTNCYFEENMATDGAGALGFFGPITSTVDGCEFISNTTDGSGGAISAVEFEVTQQPATMMLTNSIFTLNIASDQGGAVNIVDTDSWMYNNVFSINFNSGSEAGGGALSLNTGLNHTTDIYLTNNTFFNNSALLGGAIAQYTDDLNSINTLHPQNNIFVGEFGNNYQIEGGTPTVNSLGGNLNNDATTIDAFTNEKDQHEIQDMAFLDDISGDYRLNNGSPAIDAGVEEGAPEFDILGNARLDEVDAGAYEFLNNVAIDEVLLTGKEALVVFPNPVQETLNYTLDNQMEGSLLIRIYNLMGQEMMRFSIDKNETQLTEQLNVGNLTKGIYDIFISDGQFGTVQRFVKL